MSCLISITISINKSDHIGKGPRLLLLTRMQKDDLKAHPYRWIKYGYHPWIISLTAPNTHLEHQLGRKRWSLLDTPSLGKVSAKVCYDMNKLVPENISAENKNTKKV